MAEFQEAIQLIGAHRQLNPSNTGRCVELMEEFLRREALWALQLNLINEIPFANLASAISNDAHSEPYAETIKRYTYTAAESRCCAAMLNWYGVTTELVHNNTQQPLPDPYEPILAFFRLGGTFDREHRVFIEVNNNRMIQANTIQQSELSKVNS
ncbi:MAG: hypothetical protein V4719_29070 [Planctomycetota bacterium]